MNKCPITYEILEEGKYSKNGLKLLSKGLKELHDFPYSSHEQLVLADQFSNKISIQGVQPKLSLALNQKKGVFEVVESGGRFILKPPHALYKELPQNEDLTMKMAQLVGIEIPMHGMIYNKDGSLSYFISRFDRLPKGKKLPVEDFSQLLGYGRETKYASSMEKIAAGIDMHCTFPLQEKIKLFTRVIFSFLVGNEDMHLKNFSILIRDQKVTLSPAYDLLNTTIVTQSGEEIALPIRGKKSNLTRFDLIEYFGKERLGLTDAVIQSELSKFQKAYQFWRQLLNNSFLSPAFQKTYWSLVESRYERLGIDR